jgi:quercetin dioxygenase-like cupin family protein
MGANEVNDEPPGRHGEPVRLSDLATELLADAGQHHSRRSARTILSGTSMRATVIALVAEAELGEHEPPPAATLQVVRGEVVLLAGEHRWSLSVGDVMTIPQVRHSLVASTDSVVLLTVALH